MIWSFFSINSFCLWIFFRIRFVKWLTRDPEKFTKMLHSNSTSHDRKFFQEFVMQLLDFFSRFVHFYWLFLNITTIDGNGAEFFQSPNFKRHLIKRISDFFQIKSWNRLVSVLAGKSITTTPPLAKNHFWTRFLISRQYGGLQKTFSWSRLCFNPSISFVKYFSHLWFSELAHGSSVNLNSWSNSSNVFCGVARLSVALVNIHEFNISILA